ncbi:uncharacterized protein LOC111080393 [Drosophila obscura]|uniref:uncharacterized protein LOC111080393 n=1 Tax=Drosophila obscura TaxID=7282 RepID=UPI001BB24707|nr:uncharacterized protein LOC111080393 [Drosophila obscura]
MSSLTNDMYYAEISCPERRRTILRGFFSPTIENIFDAAAQIGITGQYLISAKDNTIIGDKFALRYLLERNHMILVCDSLDYRHPAKVSLEVAGETTTEEEQPLQLDMEQDLEDLELTSSEKEMLHRVVGWAVYRLQQVPLETNTLGIRESSTRWLNAFRKFLSRQTHSSV